MKTVRAMALRRHEAHRSELAADLASLGLRLVKYERIPLDDQLAQRLEGLAARIRRHAAEYEMLRDLEAL